MSKKFWALLLLVGLGGCRKSQPVPDLSAWQLEACDPAGYVACVQQTALLSIPVSDAGLSLTYSSEWKSSAKRPSIWDASSLALGGWSINLVERYDPANHILINGDGSWRLAESVSLPSGEHAVPAYDGTKAYVFDSGWRHVRTVDGRLGMELVTIKYDAAGRLASVDGSVDSEPVHVSVQRNSEGQAQSLAGIDRGETFLSFDGGGRLTGVRNPAGETTRIGWNSAGLVESETDAGGGVQQFTYDSSGQLASASDADGVTQKYERKASAGSMEVDVSTALGRRWTYRTEAAGGGIRRTFTKPDGTQTILTSDSQGNCTLKLADGTAWTIGVVASPVWGMASPVLTPIVETRPDGVNSRQEVKHDLQAQRGLPFVLKGSVKTTINGQLWTQDFDPDQHTMQLLDPRGRRAVMQYDGNGRVLSDAVPGAAPVSYTYNTEGRRMSQTIGTGKLASTSRYAYDPDSGQIVTTRADGTVEKTILDKAGRTISAAAGDGSTVIAAYDAAGRINQIQPPGGLTFTFGLSPAGRATGFAPPMVQGDASVEISEYDRDGRLRAISAPGNRSIIYDYDSSGQVTGLSFDQGKRSVSYDSNSGLMTQASDPSGVTISYRYTGSSQTGLSWSGSVHGSISMALDADGRGIRESVNGGSNLDFDYDPAGNLTEVGPLSLTRDPATGLVTRTTLGVVETQQQFDEDNRLIHASTTAAGKLLFDVRYTRDSFGRIKMVTESAAGGKTHTTEYSYDRADRLASVRVDGRPAETDDYDPAGNRVRVIRAGRKVEASYDDRDRVKNFGARQYIWKPDGTLAGITEGRQQTSFVYDDLGALRKVSLPDDRKIHYSVDAEGRRVGREVDGKFVAGYVSRPDGLIAAETDAAGNIRSRFGYDDRRHLALVERGRVTYRVLTDAIGSPRLIIDARTGAITEAITYDAWGNVTGDTSPGFIPVGFAGGLRDPDTGLVRFGARDYDPVAGGWTAADLIRFNGGDSNLYRYAMGDPVNLSDPSGLFIPFLFFPPAIAAANAGLMLGAPVAFGALQGAGGANFVISLYRQLFPPDSGSPGGNGTPPGHWCLDPSGTGACFNPPPVNLVPLNGSSGGNGPGSGGGGGNGGGGGGGGGSGPTGPPGGSGPGGSGPGGPGGSPPGSPGGPGGGGPGGGGPGGGGGGGGNGEPHLHTISGVHFDFQMAGEFLIATSRDGKYAIQARQEPLSTEAVAITSAVAANVNGDRVGVYIKEPSFVMVNGAPINELELERRLPHGGKLQRHGAQVIITYPDGGRLAITRVAGLLNYMFYPSPAGNFTGLLGTADGTPARITSRDGRTLIRGDLDFADKLYQDFGNTWRIKPSESLFHYWPGESTARFTDLNFPPKRASVDTIPPLERAKAESICRAMGVRTQPLLDDCILDVGITGLPAFSTASVGIHLLSVSGSAEGSSYASASPPSSRPDQFTIKLGDTVSPDHGAPGMGKISVPGEIQSYAFLANAGAIIYLRASACEGAGVVFDLRDPANNLIGGRGGCGDFGPTALASTGTYHLIAHADQGPAKFNFALLPTTFEQYSIKVGDTVSPDHPAAGAGSISRLGERQAYSFNGIAGTILYMKVEHCEGDPVSFELRNAANQGIVGGSACGDFGPTPLPSTGTYRIVVNPDRGASSRYSFSLLTTTFDQYQIKIGETVSPDYPVKGAGVIAKLGERQAYTFSARAGETISVKVGPCDGPPVSFELQNPVSAGITGAIHCSSFGPVTLPSTGTYRILVNAERAANAHYTFSLLPSVPKAK